MNCEESNVTNAEGTCWKDILQKKLKDNSEPEKDLILIEVKDAGPECRCASCDSNFKIEVYYSSSGKFRQKVVCEHCGVEYWTKS